MNRNLSEVIYTLKKSFPEGYVDLSNIFVAHRSAHRRFGKVCFNLNHCLTAQEVIAAAIEYLTYDCFKSMPFKTPSVNEEFHSYMLKGINGFLQTSFSAADIKKIYYRLGNGINHRLTMEFVAAGYDIKFLDQQQEDRLISANQLLEAINNVEYRARSLEKTSGGNDVLRRLMPRLIAAQPTVTVAGKAYRVNGNPCQTCENSEWPMPQCKVCDATNNFKYYHPKNNE